MSDNPNINLSEYLKKYKIDKNKNKNKLSDYTHTRIGDKDSNIYGGFLKLIIRKNFIKFIKIM